MTLTITAQAAHAATSYGTTVVNKDADGLFHTASTVKLLTCLVARDWIDVDTDSATMTVNYSPLLVGDVLTYSDMIHAALLPSNNGAAVAIGVDVGRRMLDNPAASESAATARFLDEMRAKAASFGWVGYNITDVVGSGTAARLSTRMLCDLMRHIHDNDPWMFGVSGTLNHTLTITGGRTTTANITHSAATAFAWPEFLAAKTGTWAGVAHLVVAWEHPNGTVYTSAIAATTEAARYTDMRAVIDEAILSNLGRRRVSALAGVV